MTESSTQSPSWTPGQVTWWMLALVLGIGLRAYHAESLAESVYEWESDGFVMSLEGRGWDAINRVRPAGLGLVLDRLCSSLGVTTVLGTRWVCVGLSLLALFAALDLAVALSRVTGMTRRSIGRAVSWGTMAWAVHPTLIRSAVSPTPEVLLGGGLCLALAGLARCRADSWTIGWLLFCLGSAVAVVVGGTVVAVSLVLGLLVYLAPIPRLPAFLGAVLGVGLALGAGAMAQRGPSGMGREWVPDTAPAHSLLALAGVPPIYPANVSFHAEERELESLSRAQDALANAPPLDLALSILVRLGKDLSGPRRLAPLLSTVTAEPSGDNGSPTRRVLGVFDVVMRGGLLLFALAVLGLTRRKEVTSSWPRAAIAVAGLVLLIVGAATAVGPLTLASLDLVLLGAAAAGVAGADPARPWTRRLAFMVGGTLLCTLLITGGVDDEPLDPWLKDMGQLQHEGEQVALLLQHGGPSNLIDELRACHLLSRPQAPFLRRPRLAMAHALAATMFAPDSDDAVVALISSQAECGLYREAAMLAESAHSAAPSGTEQARRMELMLDWVVKEQRDAGLR